MQMRSILISLLFLFSESLFAQKEEHNKFAVLTAINDYYLKPGVKHPHSLRGCVNDINAIRELLITRFGFNPANIKMLYNENVTKKNIIDAMHQTLQSCKAGDAFVFYYSGHGSWMSNPMNKDDAVKKGMSQSMVMSDLYSPNLDCLLTDEMVKQVFNEFVDKKVVVTSLFDCCYSGNLSMGYTTEYWSPFFRPETKSFLLAGIYYLPEKIKPVGCPVDSLGHVINTKDSDHDGISDCMDWEINSPRFSKVDSMGASLEDISAEDFMELSEKFKKDHPDLVSHDENEIRSFNLKDALTVSYPLAARRPSDRKNSKFVSISAASDREPAAEVTDETGIQHGAFTKALLTVYRQNPADLSLSELLKKITSLMKDEGYSQTPTYHFDADRMKGNLVGTDPSHFSNTITTTCTKADAGSISIDKGLNTGVTVGNIFKDANIPGSRTMVITKVYDDSAIGIDKTGSIKAGHKFVLINNYTASNPIVKLFIPTFESTIAGFQSFFNTRIKPLVGRNNYADFKFMNEAAVDSVTLFYDAKNFTRYSGPSLTSGTKGANNVVFLPVPSYIFDEWKNVLAKDQNIQLVNKPEEADYVFYLNYFKPGADHAGGFAFYFHPRIDDPANSKISIFSLDNVQASSMAITSKNLQTLTQKLYELAIKTIRYKTTAWMNTCPRQ